MSGFLLILGSTSVIAASYYFLCVIKKPKIYSGNAKLRNFLDKRVPMLKEKYAPSPFYWEGRLQTVLGVVFREVFPRFFPYRRHVLELGDGGEVGLDFADVETPPDGKALRVLLFPGLTSSSQTCYVRTLVTCLNKLGVSVVVFNNRGLGGVQFKTARTYSASNTDDAVEVINYLKKKFPNERMVAIGTSLGGMVLSKYLITYPKEAAEAFEAAVIISIAWDCNAGTINLETNLINRYVINKGLTESLVKLAKKFLSVMDPPPGFNVKAILKAKTVREFDSAGTAPQFGFKSVEDYYISASTKGHVHKFPIPVFSLNAEDDPMSPGKYLPMDEAEAKGSNFALVTTAYGGHLGFLEGTGKKSVHFMERFTEQVIDAIRLYGETELK